MENKKDLIVRCLLTGVMTTLGSLITKDIYNYIKSIKSKSKIENGVSK